MFRNIRAFNLTTNITPEGFAELNSEFESQRFIPCGPSQEVSIGWVEPQGRTGEKFVEVIDGQVLVKLCVETKRVPASVIGDALALRIADVLKETGREKMGRKEKADLKEEVKLDLIVKAFPMKSYISLWASPGSQMMFVDSTSANAGDKIVTAFLNLITETSGSSGREASASPIQTQSSPDAAMAAWLLEREAPAPFDLGRECELAQTNGTKTKVRYSQHELAIDEVVDHIKAGMRPTKLQLTMGSDVSFVLGSDLCLRGISIMLAGDVAIEQKGDENSFEASFCIMSRQTIELMKSVVESLNSGDVVDVVETVDADGANLTDKNAAKAPIEGQSCDSKLAESTKETPSVQRSAVPSLSQGVSPRISDPASAIV